MLAIAARPEGPEVGEDPGMFGDAAWVTGMIALDPSKLAYDASGEIRIRVCIHRRTDRTFEETSEVLLRSGSEVRKLEATNP